MRKKILALPLVALALVACEQNDPIRQKERELEARKIGGIQDSNSPRQHSFDLWAKPTAKANYQLPQIKEDEDMSQSYWVSASAEGYTFISSKPERYPIQIVEEGYKGKAVALRTVKGLFFFGMGTDVVAGSMYNGAVDRSKLTGNALEATLFGKTWKAGLPSEMKLHYQYKSGKTVIHGQEKKLPEDIPAHDQGSIAGVFYETTVDATPLNGTNLHTDKRIVARAFTLVSPSEPAQTWLPLSLKFEVVDAEAYKAVDFNKKTYALALVFSSSAKGDQYIGAIGSELLIDELSLITKK